MTEVGKLLYIVVEEDAEAKGNEESSFRYTRPVLQSTLQLMGCKARHAFKISQTVFEIMRKKCLDDSLAGVGVIQWGNDFLKVHPLKENSCDIDNQSAKMNGSNHMVPDKDGKPFDLYKKRTTIVIKRRVFIDVVCDALSEYKYVGPNQRADFVLACRIRERKESVTVLLCGTSGCGKSTLSALLASRLGITTVLSTDSIRHMMRSFVDENQNPLLWSSTYHAGEHLDPVAVSEAKAKRKAKKEVNGVFDASTNQPASKEGSSLTTVDLVSHKQMAIEGFKAQSEMVIDSLDRLITAWEERKELVVVEGVHLSLNFVMGLMKKHPSIIPFMIYIANEDKHMERFAVRANSPKASEGHAKELKEEMSVYGSDEEVDDTREVDSDEDLSDDAKEHMHEEMEGSVDEESTKSDEEYDDLAMQDIQENGYFTDLELESSISGNQHDTITSTHTDKYKQNLARFLRTKSESATGSLTVNSKRLSSSGSLRVRGRSYSISASGKNEPAMDSLAVKSKRLPSSGSLRVRGRSYSISASGKDERASPLVSRASSSVKGRVLSPGVSSGLQD
ncbi:hypothetical protein L1987_84055 [Smallanthus sonchifolius]|uniref:Uncharacterized protein n=1 Tax=Smallanthus sonchifolius TaxID=185202 RepID=A0ACB8YEK5_9ASTR|nr:hypothetical protein L1987_84055 [Smallanthus sonchifolius]